MLTVHHLGVSQSERIVWLCEELGIAYELKVHKRDPILSPASLKSLPGNPLGTAPFIQDGDVTLAESGAIIEYLIRKHADSNVTAAALYPSPSSPNYTSFLYWWHHGNGTLQTAMSRAFSVMKAPAEVKDIQMKRLKGVFAEYDAQLGKTGKWLVEGDNITAADIMSVFSLSTMRAFVQVDLEDHPNIVAYLARVGERPAYQKMFKAAEQGRTPALGVSPGVSFFEENGLA